MPIKNGLAIGVMREEEWYFIAVAGSDRDETVCILRFSIVLVGEEFAHSYGN